MSKMTVNRRDLLLGASALGLSACASISSPPNYVQLDEEAKALRKTLFNTYPPAKKAADNAAAYIIFPNITKAALLIGAMKGEGTLFAKDNIIGHYAVNGATVGIQAGIQNFSMVLFFMTEDAMAEFRASSGLELGMDVEYALPEYGSANMGASSNTYRKPVYALIFNQEGIMVGASLKGAIYTAI